MHEYRCSLDRIIDGDTIDVHIDLGFKITLSNERVRLLGINTPESRTRNLEEKALGLAAKARLKELLPKKFIIKTFKDEKGKFGRILGILYKDDDTVSINQQMCEDGFAVPYFGGNKDELEALHMANKQKLIEKGILGE